MDQQIRRVIMASLLTMFCFVAFAQKTVTGTVKDANGEHHDWCDCCHRKWYWCGY